MKRERNAASLVVALALLTSSCAYWKELIGVSPMRPVVKLQEIEVENATLSAIDLLVTLQVDNPNRFAMNLPRRKYSVSDLGLVVAQGAHDERVSIPGDSRVRVRLPVSITAETAIRLAKEFFQTSKELTALLKATALF